MRTFLLGLSPFLLLACNGGDEPSEAPPADPCEQTGAICTYIGVPGEALFAQEGQHRLDTHLYLPQDIAFGPDGIPVYPDFNNHRVRQVGADETVQTISGTGFLGDGPIGTDGCYAPNTCNAANSAWNHPTNVVPHPDDANLVYVAAWHNSRINLIDLTTGEVEWFAGNGGRQYSGDGGPAADATLDLPSSIAFDERNGDLYVSDQANHVIRRIPAGTDTIELFAGKPRDPGYDGNGGDRLEARFHGFVAQRADPGSKLTIHDGVIYVADSVNGVIRTIDIDSGVVELFAGKYESLGEGEVVDDYGNVYYVNLGSVPGYSGDGGPATEAVLNTPRDVAVGPDGTVYIADTKNHCIRAVTPDGVIDTFAGQCGTSGFGGDQGPATDALLADPFGIATDADGNVYIADSVNHVIRRVKG
jgi:hypothetical protein